MAASTSLSTVSQRFAQLPRSQAEKMQTFCAQHPCTRKISLAMVTVLRHQELIGEIFKLIGQGVSIKTRQGQCVIDRNKTANLFLPDCQKELINVLHLQFGLLIEGDHSSSALDSFRLAIREGIPTHASYHSKYMQELLGSYQTGKDFIRRELKQTRSPVLTKVQSIIQMLQELQSYLEIVKTGLDSNAFTPEQQSWNHVQITQKQLEEEICLVSKTVLEMPEASLFLLEKDSESVTTLFSNLDLAFKNIRIANHKFDFPNMEAIAQIVEKILINIESFKESIEKQAGITSLWDFSTQISFALFRCFEVSAQNRGLYRIDAIAREISQTVIRLLIEISPKGEGGGLLHNLLETLESKPFSIINWFILKARASDLGSLIETLQQDVQKRVEGIEGSILYQLQMQQADGISKEFLEKLQNEADNEVSHSILVLTLLHLLKENIEKVVYIPNRSNNKQPSTSKVYHQTEESVFLEVPEDVALLIQRIDVEGSYQEMAVPAVSGPSSSEPPPPAPPSRAIAPKKKRPQDPKITKYRDLRSLLLKSGFENVSIEGSHEKWVLSSAAADRPRTLIVPNHPEMARKTLSNIFSSMRAILK